MASQKKLKNAHVKFRKENPGLYFWYSHLISRMAKYIVKSGEPEVIVGFENGKYYERAGR